MFGDWSRRRWAARATLLLVLGAGFLVLDAAPAAAHGLVGTQPSNYASRILSVTPPIAGLQVEVRDLGNRIEVRNNTRYEVLVLGYSGEPYLRVGPQGVFENRRSPSVFLNRTATIVADAPPSYSATAAPVWRHISDAHVVLWHDHRVHWMGTSEPPAVAESPGQTHLVSDWFVTLQYRGQPVRVSGDLRWVPGPSAAPRLALALLVALLVGAVGFARRWGAPVALILLALAALVTVLVTGEWTATSAGPWIALLSTVYSLLGIGIAVAAAAALWRARRTPTDASAIVLVAAVVLCFGSGLADVTFLGHSQLPTTLSGPLARTFVALVLGGSVGVLVVAACHLRRPALLTVGEVPPVRSPQPAPTDVHP
jgi:hypothetical protein